MKMLKDTKEAVHFLQDALSTHCLLKYLSLCEQLLNTPMGLTALSMSEPNERIQYYPGQCWHDVHLCLTELVNLEDRDFLKRTVKDIVTDDEIARLDFLATRSYMDLLDSGWTKAQYPVYFLQDEAKLPPLIDQPDQSERISNPWAIYVKGTSRSLKTVALSAKISYVDLIANLPTIFFRTLYFAYSLSKLGANVTEARFHFATVNLRTQDKALLNQYLRAINELKGLKTP